MAPRLGMFGLVPSNGPAPAASGSSLVPAANLTSWANPGMTSLGGIPTRNTVYQSFAAATYGNGTIEASTDVQTALDACPAGQVVALGAGTFLFNNYILVHTGITLRGAGAGVTFVKKTNGAHIDEETPADAQPFVVIGPGRFFNNGQAPDLTSKTVSVDGNKGDYSITLSSASGLSAGMIVIIDELSGAGWQTDPLGHGTSVWASPDFKVVWSFHSPGFVTDDPLIATTPTSGDAASWFCRQDRPTCEVKEIASVSGNVVTFTSPLHIDYRTGHTAQLTPYTSNVHVKNAGVESMTCTGFSNGCIRFEAAAYCWAKNMEVTVWHDEGIALDNSFRIEVRDSYIHDAAWPQPGGAGYAISSAFGSAECLIENNISMIANKVMVARCAGAGSVVAYNYVDDGFINTNEAWIEIGLNASHMVGPHHVLFEGNYGFNFDSDKTHGNSIYHTIFRNWLRGVRKSFVNPHTGDTVDDTTGGGLTNGPRRCAGAAAFSYWMAFVGNVLGASGQMSGFIYNSTGTDSMGNKTIWLLGWDDWSPQPWDSNVEARTTREGNWDWLQSQQSWENATPGTAIANSLYLASKPAFFGSNTWPWVDPTTGTTYTLPAKKRFDDGTPNTVP
jgi:hypothetical protein